MVCISKPRGNRSKVSLPMSHIKQDDSSFSVADSCWSRNSPKASMIKPENIVAERNYLNAAKVVLRFNNKEIQLEKEGAQMASRETAVQCRTGHKLISSTCKGTFNSNQFQKQTLHDGKKNNDDEEEECHIVYHSGILKIITIWRFELITNTTASSYTSIEVVYETLQLSPDRKKETDC